MVLLLIAGGDTADWGLDEIEVNFLFNVGSVSGTVALDSKLSVRVMMTSSLSKLISPTPSKTVFP